MAWSRPRSEISEPPVDCFSKTTVLMRAVKAGAPRRVQFLLEEGCDPNLSCGVRSIRPLMMACYVTDSKKQLNIVKSLLNGGGDPALGDMHLRNSLMYACALATKDTVATLLFAAEYDLNAVDIGGNTAFHYCAMTGNVSILNLLLQELLRLRLDRNVRNNLFLTPFSTALLCQNVECAEALYNVGASPVFTTSEFKTILAHIKQNEGRLIDELIYKDVVDCETVCTAFSTDDPSMCGNPKAISRQLWCRPSSSPNNHPNSGKAFSKRIAAIRGSTSGRRATVSCSLPRIVQNSSTVSSSSPTPRSSTCGALSFSRQDMIIFRPTTAWNDHHSNCPSNRSHSFVSDSENGKTSKRPQSSLEVYDTLMARMHPARSSPLYCSPPLQMAKVDSEWTEAINNTYISTKQAAETLASEQADELSKLINPKKFSRVCSQAAPRNANGTRPPGKLSRMMSSPVF